MLFIIIFCTLLFAILPRLALPIVICFFVDEYAEYYEAIQMASGWFGSRVVSVLDSDAEGPGFKSQPRRCRVTFLGKLFTPIMPRSTKQRNW